MVQPAADLSGTKSLVDSGLEKSSDQTTEAGIVNLFEVIAVEPLEDRWGDATATSFERVPAESRLEREHAEGPSIPRLRACSVEVLRRSEAWVRCIAPDTGGLVEPTGEPVVEEPEVERAALTHGDAVLIGDITVHQRSRTELLECLGRSEEKLAQVPGIERLTA